jgi:DNA-directed RNA polymerase subunit K/omega
MGRFQFVVLSTLRAAQLIRGCTPRIEGTHKKTVTAQAEVAEGKVWALIAAPADIEIAVPVPAVEVPVPTI